MPDRILKPWPFTPAPQLVADLGGTNTRVALADGGVLRQGSIRRFANAGHTSLSDILRAYLAQTATTECSGVCVAVAGPVADGRARMTNLDWEITRDDLAALGGCDKVFILNDLQAQGHALAGLDPRHVHLLMPGEPETSTPSSNVATRLVVGAGTGFNAAPVFSGPQGVFVPPSETGHIHLPHHTEAETALARHLAKLHGIATLEEALSGRGLVALHHWTSGTDIAAADLIAALAARDPRARETGALYAGLMGRVLASLALVHLPYGGIYLIGGVARAMAPYLVELGMAESFTRMGRFSAHMARFPVSVVEDDYAGLLGCAAHLAAQRA